MDEFCMSSKDKESWGNPVIGLIDRKSARKYSRGTWQTGLGQGGGLVFLIQDMVDSLRNTQICAQKEQVVLSS